MPQGNYLTIGGSQYYESYRRASPAELQASAPRDIIFGEADWGAGVNNPLGSFLLTLAQKTTQSIVIGGGVAIIAVAALPAAALVPTAIIISTPMTGVGTALIIKDIHNRGWNRSNAAEAVLMVVPTAAFKWREFNKLGAFSLRTDGQAGRASSQAIQLATCGKPSTSPFMTVTELDGFMNSAALRIEELQKRNVIAAWQKMIERGNRSQLGTRHQSHTFVSLVEGFADPKYFDDEFKAALAEELYQYSDSIMRTMEGYSPNWWEHPFAKFWFGEEEIEKYRRMEDLFEAGGFGPKSGKQMASDQKFFEGLMGEVQDASAEMRQARQMQNDHPFLPNIEDRPFPDLFDGFDGL
jgi:hypothetical protein